MTPLFVSLKVEYNFLGRKIYLIQILYLLYWWYFFKRFFSKRVII